MERKWRCILVLYYIATDRLDKEYSAYKKLSNVLLRKASVQSGFYERTRQACMALFPGVRGNGSAILPLGELG